MANSDSSATTVEQVAQMLGVSRSLLRFWEEEFDLPRRENGAMSDAEIAEIRLIFELIETRGLPLSEAKNVFSAEKKRDEARRRTIEKLKDIREKLTELQKML